MSYPPPNMINNRFEGKYDVIHEKLRMERYVDHHENPGLFLCAVISNNLNAAVLWSDENKRPIIHLYVEWFCKHAPSDCYGTRKHLLAWLSVAEAHKGDYQ